MVCDGKSPHLYAASKSFPGQTGRAVQRKQDYPEVCVHGSDLHLLPQATLPRRQLTRRMTKVMACSKSSKSRSSKLTVLCRPPRVSTATEAGSWQYSEDALAKTVECSRLVTPGRRLLVLLDEAGRAFTGYKDDCTAPQGLESYHVVRWLHDWRMNREGKLDEDELIWALTGKQTRFSGTLVQMISNMKLAQDKLLRQYALAE